MKRIVCILSLILAFSCVMTLMVGCKKEDKKEVTYGDYWVKVVDGLGNPMSQVVVKFTYPDGQTTKSRITENDGIARLNNVPDGTYSVTLEKGFSNAQFDKSQYEITADKKSIMIVVRDETKTSDIYGNFENGFAYSVGVGSYVIPTVDDYWLYLVFTATSSGVYKFTLNSEDADATIGYYGIPFFVQSTHCGDGEYDGRTFDIIIQDPATPYVIGIHTAKAAETSVVIERTGDAPFDPYHAPWTVVPATDELTKCNLPEDVVLTDLDVTDENLSITLGDDGYYYTADGKLVYIRINSVSNARYLDVSIAYIAGFIDSNFGQNFGGYVYDDNGDFVGKYSYNEMIGSYYEVCDSMGVYPLTEELAEAIKCHGNSTGWWNPNAANYLFSGVDVIIENAWMFLLCTAD